MAFDLINFTTAKYRYTYTGEEGNEYAAEIHQDGFGGTPTTVEAVGRRAVDITWSHDGDDEYSAVEFSEATVSFYDGTNAIANDLIGNLNDVEEKYLFVVRTNEVSSKKLKWVGNIDPEGITYQEEGQVPLTITAADGLGRLNYRPYVAPDGVSVNTGPANFISVIADCLNDQGLGLDFYVSSSLYHKAADLLAPAGATKCPPEFTWIDKLAFVADKNKGHQSTVSKLSVLESICFAWGMKCFQADGAWHLIQANHLHTTGYRRWRYNSLGAQKEATGDNLSGGTSTTYPGQNYEDVDPRITVADDNIKRTVSTRSYLKAYNSSAMRYEHGPIEIMRFPSFEPSTVAEATAYLGGDYPWSTSPNADIHGLDGGTWGMGLTGIDTIVSTKTGYVEISVDGRTPIVANGTGTGANTVDEAIGDSKTTQRSQARLQSGEQFTFAGKFITLTVDNPPPTYWEIADLFIAVQIKIYTGTPQYLKWATDGTLEWTTDVNWLLLKNQANLNGLLSIYFPEIDVMPADADVEITLGPIMGNDSALGIFKIPACAWDYAQISPVLPDGSFNNNSVTSFNYITRTNPRPVRRTLIVGDGPSANNKGSMYSDATLSTITEDWEETTLGHDGLDTNEDHSVVLGRMLLKSMNTIRAVRSSAYLGLGEILTPLDVLSVGSDLFSAWSLSASYTGEYTSGSWYIPEEVAFTDDLIVGVATGNELPADFGGGSSGSQGSAINQVGTEIIPLSRGGTGENLTAPGDDSILYYDATGAAVGWLRPVTLDLGGTGASLSAPGQDAVFVYDQAGTTSRLANLGPNLSYDSGTNTLNAAGGGGTSDDFKEWDLAWDAAESAIKYRYRTVDVVDGAISSYGAWSAWVLAAGLPAWAPPALAIEKIMYANGNEVWEVNEDLTSPTLVYTWAGAGNITSLAIDHKAQRVLMTSDTLDTIIHAIDYDGGNPATLHTKNASARCMLSVSEVDDVVVYSESPTNRLTGSIFKIPRTGGSATNITTDGRAARYIPEHFADPSDPAPVVEPKILYIEPSGTDSLEYININSGGAFAPHSPAGTSNSNTDYYSIDGVYFAFDGNAGVIKTYGPRVANWLAASNTGFYQGEIDRVSYNLYVAGSSSDVAENGIWKFTDVADADTSNSTHSNTACDLQLTSAGTDNVQAIAIRYNQPWQSFVTP